MEICGSVFLIGMEDIPLEAWLIRRGLPQARAAFSAGAGGATTRIITCGPRVVTPIRRTTATMASVSDSRGQRSNSRHFYDFILGAP